jgi:hypothetical protein
MSQQVKGFSLDTSIVQALGFHFEGGALAVLPQQLPSWMKLYVSDIVRQEIVSHMQSNTKQAFDSLNAAVKNIDRLTALDASSIEEAVKAVEPKQFGKDSHEERIKKYMKRFEGEFVPVEGKGLLEEVFDRYFSLRPPFENVKDKKHEFPDAAALITLDRLAEKTGTKLILVSGDKGWSDYADQSKNLYCVKNLDDLTALYTSESTAANKIKEKIASALSQSKSKLAERFRQGIEGQLHNLGWAIEAQSEAGFSVDPQVDEIEVLDLRPNVEDQRIWMKNEQDEICVVEVQCDLTCQFEISADFSHYDSIDKDEMSMGTGSTTVTDDVIVSVFLTIQGDLIGDGPDEWEVDVELSDDTFWIDAGDMNPDWYNQGPEDDGS